MSDWTEGQGEYGASRGSRTHSSERYRDVFLAIANPETEFRRDTAISALDSHRLASRT